MTNKRGFTLIELLVVISIIALLMAVMLPALAKVREAAKSVVCKSNLRSINMAAALWSVDNKGWALGMSWSWPDPAWEDGRANNTSLHKYTNSLRNQRNNNVYACPSAKSAGFFGVQSGNDIGMGTLDPDLAEKTITYGINSWIASAQPEGSPGSFISDPAQRGAFGEGPGYVYWYDHGSTKIDKIRQPDQSVYFMDHEFYSVAKQNFNPLIPPSNVKSHYAPNGVMTRWHGKKPGENYGYANIAWVDGHVSEEPDDLGVKPKLFKKPRWTYYFYDH
jgi:prepilin-type N-terminal cleavage/methylation domain-containing protein/prepilin-type processing-associated H-X9-DG protein